MEKLRQIINRTYDTGRLPKGFQPASFRMLEIVYDDLLHHRPTEFIQSEILDLLQQCKINVQPYRIGWIAYAD